MNGRVAKKVRKEARKLASEDLLKILVNIKAIADKQTYPEMNPDWQADDGGNFDDTYQAGIEDGEILFARQLIAEFEKEIKENGDSKVS